MWLLLLLPGVFSLPHIWDDIRRDLDYSIDPCDNFYDHVCSEKLLKNLPADNWRSKIKKIFDENMPKEYDRLLKMVGEDNEEHLSKLASVVAYAKYIQDHPIEHTEAIDGIRDLVSRMKASMEQTVLESKTLHEKEIAQVIAKRLRDITVHEIPGDHGFYEAFSSMEEPFQLCFDKMCYDDKAQENERRSFCGKKVLAEAFEKFPSDLGKLFNDTKIRSDNAIYSHSDNKIYVSPHYYRPKATDIFTMLATVGFTIAHEIGHSIFKEKLAHKPCLPETMKQSCKMFSKKGVPTAQNLTNYQMYFYAQAADWCEDKYNQRESSVHSLPIIKVNGQFRQFDEFRHAFQCKEGDKMVASEKEKCILTGVNSLLKKDAEE